MKRYIVILSALALMLSSLESCTHYNPLDSYSRIPPEREETAAGGMNGLFASGFGTPEAPYVLKTANHVLNMRKALVAGQMTYFSLEADVNLANHDWIPLNPVDPYANYITFEGNNHVISNLTCMNQSYASFFGVLYGECRNVGFVNASISAPAGSGAGVIGGYLGLANTPVHNCVLENCYTTGSVNGREAGGLVGTVGKTEGGKYCKIVNCYSTANVTASTHGGGIAGRLYDNSEIRDSYATGSVSGTTSAGGVVGYALAGSVIDHCIAWNKNVSGGDNKTNHVVGDLQGSISNCYALTNMMGNVPETPQQNVQVKDAAGLQAAFSNVNSSWYANGGLDSGYPVLNWQVERGDYMALGGHTKQDVGPVERDYEIGFDSGKGTQAEPYVIKTLNHLRSMHDVDYSFGELTYFRLEADIDLAEVDWEPLNSVDPAAYCIDFDGGNHKISNFNTTSKTFPSFFGILKGNCRNVVFENAKLNNKASLPAAIVAAYVGYNDYKLSTIDNVKVIGGELTQDGSQPAGAIGGIAVKANITNCEVNAKLTLNVTSTHLAGLGGIAGKTLTNVTIKNCSCSSEMITTRLTGGMVGWSSNPVVIENCESTVHILSDASGVAGHTDDRAGGIIGHMSGQGKVVGCTYKGTIECEGTSAGIAGYMEKASSVERCSFEGDIIAKHGNSSGGIAGEIESAFIRNCWAKGSVSCAGQCFGGIVGEVRCAALAADETGYSFCVIENCWSDCSLSGHRTAGGIAGRVSFRNWVNSSSNPSASEVKHTVKNCIAWGTQMSASDKGDSNSKGSCGGVVGYAGAYCYLQNSYRNPNLTIDGSYVSNVPVDQPDCSPSSPFKAGVTPGVSTTYCYPYHGKAAKDGDTVSSLASTIGWSTDIWDLSSDFPKLK